MGASLIHTERQTDGWTNSLKTSLPKTALLWQLKDIDYNQHVLRSSYKSKGIPRQAEVAQGVPGRLRPRIFSTFGTTRVVGRQPNAPAAFTPGEIPGTHFQRLSRPQGTWFCRKEPRKIIPSDTTGDRSWDCPTSSAAP